MKVKDVVTTERRGATLLITINRPEARNAIDSRVASGLVDAFHELDDSNKLRVGVVTGAGGVFSSGMDLKAFASDGVPTGMGALLVGGATKPLIAAVEGFALAGGLELALVCDIIVAADDSVFGIPEVRVGLVASGGGLFRLPARLSLGAAMEMALTGDPIDAARAHQLGLANRLVDRGQACAEALTLAERIGRNAPLGLVASKQVVRMSGGRTEAELWMEQESVTAPVFASVDAAEGAAAFAEKRAPVWIGE